MTSSIVALVALFTAMAFIRLFEFFATSTITTAMTTTPSYLIFWLALAFPTSSLCPSQPRRQHQLFSINFFYSDYHKLH
jgi:hypothetical protein